MIKSLRKLAKKHYIQWILSFCFSSLCLMGVIFNEINDPSFDETYFSNKTARIDIIPIEGEGIKLSTDFNGDIIYPDWANNKHGQGMIFMVSITKKWQTYDISIHSNRSGIVKIILRGPWRQHNKKTYPVKVNYRNLHVDDRKLEMKTNVLWHDEPFEFTTKVEEGKLLKVSTEIKIPSITLQELIKYNSLNKYISFSLFLIFLFMFKKIIGYFTEFYYNGGSRIDIIFLVVFFIFLFMPMSHISDAEKSEQENRILAEKPQLIATKWENNSFSEQFGAWFNDRFLGREQLISLYSKLKFHINKIYLNGGAIFLSNNKWMFNGTNIHVEDEKKQKEIILQLNKLYEFCSANNIKLYLLLVPIKSTVYHEILDENYHFNYSSLDAYNKFIKDLRKKVNFPIIYPYEELRKAKEKDFVFFKQSHHWTDWGAYNGYVPLINEIKKDFSDINIVTLDDYKKQINVLIRDDWGRDFNIGNTTRLLQIDSNYAKKHLLKDNYTYYDHKNADDIVFNKSKYIKNFEQRNKGSYKLLLIGNSHNEDLLQFLPYSVQKLMYIRINMGQVAKSETFKLLKHYRKEIVNFGPDIMVLSISANLIGGLSNLTLEN